MVYTSDLKKRPKTQQGNHLANSVVVPKKDSYGDFSNYVDLNKEESLISKLSKKRQNLKSQQQKSRYEKKHRGTFAWDLIEPNKTATVRQSRTRNFRNLENDFEIKSQNIKKMYDNQKTNISTRENFEKVLEHNHVSYTNGKLHGEIDKWQTSAQLANGIKRPGSTGNETAFKSVLTNTFKVHPLDAMDVQKYKKHDLVTEMLQKAEKISSDKSKIEIKVPTPLEFYHQ